MELLLRQPSPPRLTRGGQPFEPFGAIPCCMAFQTASHRPRRPVPFRINGVPQTTRWPLASEAWMDHTAAKGASFFHFRFAAWYGDAEHEGEWSDIGGPYLGDGPEWNLAFWQKARELTIHAAGKKANVEAVVVDTWYCKHCQWGDQPCAWPREDVDACGRRPSPGIERFIRKVVSELGCFANVIWITDNEGGEIQGTRREWYEWVRTVIRDEEQKSGCGVLHLVGTNNTDYAEGPFDYVATHDRAALRQPIAGKHTENNERNPAFPVEQEHANFCTARAAGLHWWLWRAEMPDADFERTLTLFGQGCAGPVGCFAPEPDDPLWGEAVTGAGQKKAEVEAAQAAVGERCGSIPPHEAGNATLDALGAELRKRGECASRSVDSVFVLAPDGWWEEYHAVRFTDGCWSRDPALNPKLRWKYNGPNPTPPSRIGQSRSAGGHLTASSSTSKTSVAFGPMSRPAPRSP
jgi:hypothetical protein